jgi:hypothetical protein
MGQGTERPFACGTTARFDRLLKKFASKHPEFKDRHAETATISDWSLGSL